MLSAARLQARLLLRDSRWGRPRNLLDLPRLMAQVEEKGSSYRGADPFPHIVLDEFLPHATLEAVIAEIPRWSDRSQWLCFDAELPDGRAAQHNKLHLSDERRLGRTTCALLRELRSAAFLQILEKLTGIDALIPDAHNLGGGLHVCFPGSILRIHADFNRHPLWGLDRRLNLLLYLNERWEEDWGGALELWPADMSECRRRILPIANRCVVFNTSRDSFHGHPQAVTCPPAEARKSLALYYYTNGRPTREAGPDHSTLWQDLPEERGGVE